MVTKQTEHISLETISTSQPPLAAGLYVTATPIGNLGDITVRALAALNSADLILCEDTRHTAKLCQAYQITTKRQAYHDHNGAKLRPAILKQLRDGAAICLVSDAGTPLISDPGYKLVEEALAHDINVTPLPGPCAAIAALSVAGIASDKFLFAGFPPPKPGARTSFFTNYKTIPSSLIFYESASRLHKTLKEMATIFGNRKLTVARELTKKFEQVFTTRLEEIEDHLEDLPAKGEIVILLGPLEAIVEEIDIDSLLVDALQTMSVKEAATMLAQDTGLPRRDIYNRALKIKEDIRE